MRDTARIFFTVGDLDYLQHGGRIGKLAGLAGSVLNLKPLITLEGGSIDSSGIARSRKKSMAKTIELLKSYFKENKENPVDYEYAVGYGYDMQEGIQYKKQVDEALKEMKKALKTNRHGSVPLLLANLPPNGCTLQGDGVLWRSQTLTADFILVFLKETQ